MERWLESSRNTNISVAAFDNTKVVMTEGYNNNNGKRDLVYFHEFDLTHHE